MIQTKFTLELTRNGVQKEIYCKAGETEARRMIIALTVNGEVFPLEEGHQCRMYLQGDSDQSPVYYPAEGFLDTEYNLVYFDLPQCSAGGKTLELRITKGAQIIYSPCWRLIVNESIGDDAAQQAGGGSVVYEEKLITAPETTGPLPSGAESVYLDGSGNTKRTPFVGKVAVLNIDNGIDATVAQAAYNYIVGGYVVFLVYGGLSYPVWSAEYTSANNWDVMYLDDYSNETAVMLVTQSGTQTYREYVKMSPSDWSTVMQLIFGKQDKLTFDNVPTMDSSNPVKSGGVYQALAGKQNTLTAGENIHIENDVICADGYELPYASSSVKGGVTIDNKSVIMSGGTQLRSVMIEIKGSSGNVSVYSPMDLKMLATSKRAMCWNNDPIIACTSDGISAGFVFYFIKDGGMLCKGEVSSSGLGPYSVTITEIMDVDDLTAVPTNVSAFTNDAGYCVPLTTEEMATVISSVVDIVSVNGDVLATDSNTILYL